MTYIKTQVSDKISICLSLCCILHCIALPIIIFMIPSISSLWINDENVHIFLVLLAIPISLFAMAKSLRIHNNYKCISLAVVGLLLLIAAIFMHDIGLVSEHGHTEEHGKTGEHEHEEHGGIGETLETIFTVIGGLVLISAHYLNIKSSNKSS